jgi:very-short-patch-repair endonuclease
MQLHNRSYLKDTRRELRNSSTAAEAELWNHLKAGQQQGRKFRRQHSVRNYILDFYCPSEKLAIELDGQVHYSAIADSLDQERDRELNGLGIKVLRFENKEVFQNIEDVLHEINSGFSK